MSYKEPTNYNELSSSLLPNDIKINVAKNIIQEIKNKNKNWSTSFVDKKLIEKIEKKIKEFESQLDQPRSRSPVQTLKKSLSPVQTLVKRRSISPVRAQRPKSPVQRPKSPVQRANLSSMSDQMQNAPTFDIFKDMSLDSLIILIQQSLSSQTFMECFFKNIEEALQNNELSPDIRNLMNELKNNAISVSEVDEYEESGAGATGASLTTQFFETNIPEEDEEDRELRLEMEALQIKKDAREKAKQQKSKLVEFGRPRKLKGNNKHLSRKFKKSKRNSKKLKIRTRRSKTRRSRSKTRRSRGSKIVRRSKKTHNLRQKKRSNRSNRSNRSKVFRRKSKKYSKRSRFGLNNTIYGVMDGPQLGHGKMGSYESVVGLTPMRQLEQPRLHLDR